MGAAVAAVYQNWKRFQHFYVKSRTLRVALGAFLGRKEVSTKALDRLAMGSWHASSVAPCINSKS